MSDGSKSIDLYYEINVSPPDFIRDDYRCSMHMSSNHCFYNFRSTQDYHTQGLSQFSKFGTFYCLPRSSYAVKM